MGVQQFGRKKIDRLNRKWGWEMDMIWNSQGTTHIYEARDAADNHYIIDTRTGSVEPHEPSGHMTSCRTSETAWNAETAPTRRAVPGPVDRKDH